MRITLTVTAGPHEGRVFTFTGHDTFLVGRSKRVHFQLPAKDRFFSRMHFLVEVNPPHCRIMDLGSRNGTHVNGAKVTRADLKDGDQIKAGRTILRVALESDPAPSAAWPPTQPPQLEPEGWETIPPRPAAIGAVAAPQPSSPLPPVLSPAPPTPAKPAFDSLKPRVIPTGQPDTAAKRCLVCSAPILAVLRPEAALPLCLACQQAIRSHPQQIPGYQIVRELGRGGMGVVYLAVQTAAARPVALKTVIPAVAVEQAALDRFLREARILGELSHPHIVALHEMNHAAGQLFFAMEYVPGTDASRLVKSQGPLPLPRAVSLICQALEALEYAHAKGFVHRDIKPGNLLVAETEGRELVKLADFGLARAYQSSQLSGLTLTGDIGGTPAYMAPEQILDFRNVQPAADQYSIAATLYSLLTNRLIHDPPDRAELMFLKILDDDPVPIQSRRADLPTELAQVIHRALAREPGKRFPNVRKMRQVLEKFQT